MTFIIREGVVEGWKAVVDKLKFTLLISEVFE